MPSKISSGVSRAQDQPKASTLVALLQRRAAMQPDQVAHIFLSDGEEAETIWTYRQLDERARSIAWSLRRSVTPGDRVLLFYPPGLEFIAALYGCLYLRAIAVPGYPPRRNQSLARLEAIARDAQAQVALTTSLVLARIESGFESNSLLRALQWLPTDIQADDGHDHESDAVGNSDDIAFLQYTSGSTGAPKGVMLTNKNLLANAALVYQAVEHADGDKYVSWLPTFHDMGFMAGILQPMFGGLPSILMSPASFLQRPIRWLKTISRYQATTS